MQAVIRRGQTLVCEAIADLVPQTGQTLVKTLCCGICGSDLHALPYLDLMVEAGTRSGGASSLDPQKDVVFGHEFCAEVIEHGPGTQGRFKPGTRVVSMPFLVTGTGLELVGYSNTMPGGFAQNMLLNENMLIAVPNGLATDLAALTEPFAVGAHAAAAAALEPGSPCLVLGCGPVGLAVIAALKAMGHGPVIAVDFSSARRATAERMGADIIIDPAQESPYGRWSDLGIPNSMGEQMLSQALGKAWPRPIIFECVGAPGMLQKVMEGAPPKAQIIVAGVCMQKDVIEPSIAINKQLDLRFVLGYSAEEFAATLFDIAEGRIDAGQIITGKVGLSEVAGAFEALASPDHHVKILVEPQRL
jgi:threonine dehydrogenase-like Zn-dependent dehydrogenase